MGRQPSGVYTVTTLVSLMWKLRRGGIKPLAQATELVRPQSGLGLGSVGFQNHAMCSLTQSCFWVVALSANSLKDTYIVKWRLYF